RHLIADTRMGSVPVVVVQPAWESFGSLGGIFVCAGVGPFAKGRLDQPLSLAIRSRGVRPGSLVAKAQAADQSTKAPGFVTGAVVGQDASEVDAQAPVVTDGAQQRAAGAGAALVRFDGAEGDPGVIVDGQVDELPSRP